MKKRFGLQDVTVVAQNTLFKKFFQIEEWRFRHRLFAGGESCELRRELFVRGNAVAALLFDPLRQQVVMIEQFRIGALAAGAGPWTLELVAGMVGPGETPAEVARREALEEAGCTIGELIPLYEYFVSPGGTSEQITLFCGLVDSSAVGGIHGLESEGEDICVHVLDVEEALAAIADGTIADATSILALQWLRLHGATLTR